MSVLSETAERSVGQGLSCVEWRADCEKAEGRPRAEPG